MNVQLGIDTGGTYTDAALVDDQGKVIATRKCLTTPFDLTIGIGDAIAALPQEMLERINLVSLSTTLSTNSVVENRGAPIGVLLPGYDQQQLEKSGLLDLMDSDHIVLLRGGHSGLGSEREPLDVETARDHIARLADRVSAFAISAQFGIRNPAHERALRDLVLDMTGKPVACGHELASSLGAPRRALTVALNARMIPYIQSLIDSVEFILEREGIHAPLMVVKGDGSLVNVATARAQPVTTVLSGPAASVIGASALSGLDNAIVVDMGGTTTDIAVVTDGRPDLVEEGALIGNWRPMVEAIRVFSIGLGGDSEVHFQNRVAISHRRVVPMSLLVHQYPQLLSRLEHQYAAGTSPRNNRFALRLRRNEELLKQLRREDLETWDALADGPLELDDLAATDRNRMRSIARMERLGLVIYSGFTPSDATHVLGMSDHWSREAAELGAKIWARQMRRLYGCGNWQEGDAAAPSREVFDLATEGISRKIIEAGLNQQGKLGEADASAITELLTDIILRRNPAEQRADLFHISFARDYPLVAVGGPAADYFPSVAGRLGMDLHLPEHGDTANAIGAVMGAVVQTAQVTVTQPEQGVYLLFHRDEPMRFEVLDAALARAEELARVEAHERAEASGAMDVHT
ncbi:MAG: hydantoinase/oxoprolinase family protein, partial [Gammaproteobacteria bacterium]